MPGWKLTPGPEHSPNVLTVVDEANGRTMCWVTYGATPGGQRRARLIASAPDMLAICEGVLSGKTIDPTHVKGIVSYVKEDPP